MGSDPLIAVYLVTYRRPHLLRRALRSVLEQTHRRLKVVVVNDDPEDASVEDVVAEANDQRVTLFRPLARRGAAANFNLAFNERQADFGSVLEDDNWWEPRFLQEMLTALANTNAPLAVGNELIWEEAENGEWINTGRTIWDRVGVNTHQFKIEQVCGGAVICNSSMLFRFPEAGSLTTPDEIPVDVTEHFRERLLRQEPVLMREPLVNYAVTRTTARAVGGPTWGVFQCLLIGSVFAALPSHVARADLAARLWAACDGATSPRATTLALTGIVVPEARDLYSQAPPLSKLRVLAWAIRRPAQVGAFWACRKTHRSEFDFLTKAPLTQELAASLQLGAA